MVQESRHYDYEEEESHLRRFSRGHGYDRELPPAGGHGVYPGARAHHPSSELSNGEQSSENEANPRPRSRIPVACGRCRKRKIRCSGDNGGPCHNCKNAGNDQCQFLRVSSQDLPMKSDTGNFDFDVFGSASSRLNCRVIPYGSYGQQSNHPVEPYQYRTNPLGGYQYPVKSCYGLPSSYPEFPEENVDYGLQSGLQSNTSYQLMGAEHLAVPSNYSSSRSSWAPQPQLPKQSLFIEPESAYNHSQPLPYPGNSYPLRTPVASEPKGLPLNGGPPSFPNPMTANDRVLPFPAANRPAQVGTGTPFLRTTTALQAGYQAYDNLPVMNTNMLNGVKSHNAGSASENGSIAGGYLPLSSNSPESLSSIASSQLSYTSQHLRVAHQQQELYTPSSEHLYSGHSPAHLSDPASEPTYGPSSTLIRGPNSNQSSVQEGGGLPPLTNGNQLANGHRYVPYESGSNPLPATYVDQQSVSIPQQSLPVPNRGTNAISTA